MHQGYHAEKEKKIGTCLHKKCVRIFEHNFVADKAKIRRHMEYAIGLLTPGKDF